MEEYRQREKEIRRRVLERERRLIIRNEKIRKFKGIYYSDNVFITYFIYSDLCFKKQYDPGFLALYFKDEREIRRVELELYFMAYKLDRERDTQYWLSSRMFLLSYFILIFTFSALRNESK